MEAGTRVARRTVAVGRARPVQLERVALIASDRRICEIWDLLVTNARQTPTESVFERYPELPGHELVEDRVDSGGQVVCDPRYMSQNCVNIYDERRLKAVPNHIDGQNPLSVKWRVTEEEGYDDRN